ncbi:MAG: class I SAM-dependent rRNA methyltransferase [Erysipelotrichaceae bacterium]
MKTFRDYPVVTVSDKGKRWLENNHPWLYYSDVVDIDDNIENGDIVDVISLKGKYLGSGFFSQHSKIKVRLLSRNANDVFDDEFFYRRLQYSYQYRKTVMAGYDNYRLVFGEADQLPGLTIDRYNDILVSQIACYGMERIRNRIYKLLLQILKEDGINIKAIYQRNDVASRSLEGLTLDSCYAYTSSEIDQDCHEVIIDENGIKFWVDYVEGQKTGFFLDQKFNRLLVRDLVKGMRVLDCFTHTGSFALNCVKGKASRVVALDISAKAISQAKRNAELNGFEDKIEFEVGDTFDYLDKVNKKEFDVIILDPPAFTKSKDTTINAYNGYKNINARAMKLLPRGGYLVSCSCSHFMSQTDFEKMLTEAAAQASVSLKQVSFSQQGKDHPILLNINETNYLKFYILQVI